MNFNKLAIPFLIGVAVGVILYSSYSYYKYRW